MAVAPREDIYGISSAEKGEGTPGVIATQSPEDGPKVYTAEDAHKEAPPPTYESLFGKVKKIRVESKSTKEFCVKCTRATCETATLQIVLGFFLCVFITNIVIGAVYFGDCPGYPEVPRFLVIYGSGLFILMLIYLIEYTIMKKKGRTREEQDKHTPKLLSAFRFALIIFAFVFFIIGAVQSIEGFQSDKKCDDVPRIYAFIFCVTVLSLLGLFLLFCICGGCADNASRKKNQQSKK